MKRLPQHPGSPPVRVRIPSHNSKLAPQEVEYPEVGKPRFTPSKIAGCYAGTSAIAIDKTCPTHCRWRQHGCSALASQHQHRLETAATGWDPLEIIREEDRLIRERLPPAIERYRGSWIFRFHEAGDVPSAAGARILASTAEWMASMNVPAWTYTRRWMEIERADFGAIHVLASVTTVDEMQAARVRGYRPAVLVASFPRGPRAFRLPNYRLPVLPCLAEVRSETCSSCRRCFDAKLHEDVAIGFAPHGRDRQYVRGVLDTVQ